MFTRCAIITDIKYQCILKFVANSKSTLSKTRRVCVIYTNIDPRASLLLQSTLKNITYLLESPTSCFFTMFLTGILYMPVSPTNTPNCNVSFFN